MANPARNSKLRVERRHGGAVLHLTLNAPKANVLDSEMMRAIAFALQEHGRAPDLRAIAFEGAGDHFSFGASVEEHRAEQVADMLQRFHGLFRQLLELAVPTVAIVRGQCLGGGMELAAYCTWVLASDDARFGQPEIKLNVFPPVASVLLPWRLGGGHALDLCTSGRSIDAAEGLRIGLVSRVCDDPRAAADDMIRDHLLPLSASSLRFADRAVRASLRPLLGATLDAVERSYVDELMATPDANEGIEAFLARRRR